MYSIEKTPYGFKLVFSGMINAVEMSRWTHDSKTVLTSAPSAFCVLFDLRDLKPLAPDAQQQMHVGQRLLKEHGLVRSAVIVGSAVLAVQSRRNAQQSGVYEWEHYIDSSRTNNSDQIALSWLVSGIDPDA